MRGKAQATLDLEAAIVEIVEERAPITVRGIAYALFVRDLLASMAVSETRRVSRITTDMREDGTLDWTQIVDDSRTVEQVDTWSDPDAIIRAAVKGYRRNNWQDQPTVVEVWSEKSTVQGVLAPVLDDLGVTFRVLKGWGSFTAVRQAAEDSNGHAGKATVALYIGDWDPSGLYMSEVDLPERLERYGGRWKLERIAIVKPDTRRLPHFDAATKDKDPRYRWFVARHGRRCWELDAMNPNILRDRVRKAIEAYIDRPLWRRAIEIEEAELASMQGFHAAWQGITRKP